MYAYASTPAAAMLAAAIDGSGRTQRELAQAIGMAANHLSMVRRGEAVLPVHRCAPTARALGLDRGALIAACVESYPGNRSWRALAIGLDGA